MKTLADFYFAEARVRSIAMSGSVCPSVFLSARISQISHVKLHEIFCGHGCISSDDNIHYRHAMLCYVIWFVLPFLVNKSCVISSILSVLRMSYLAIGQAKAMPEGRILSDSPGGRTGIIGKERNSHRREHVVFCHHWGGAAVIVETDLKRFPCMDTKSCCAKCSKELIRLFALLLKL